MGGRCKIQGPGPWCGTAGGYTNHACRCDACKAAFAAMIRRARSKPGRTRNTLRAERKAVNAAVKWVRAAHPDLWRSMIDAGYAAVEAEEGVS